MAMSMSGCGEAVCSEGETSCRVVVKSVNNRFFKMALRTREGLAALEPRIETVIRESLRRGSVQVAIELAGPAAPGGRQLDHVQLAAYLDDLRDFCSTHRLPEPHNIDALLPLPGVLVDRHDTAGDCWPLVERTLREAVLGLASMRSREGAAMADSVREIVAAIGEQAAAIRGRVPQAIEDHRRRLETRVARLLEPQGMSVDPAGMAREIALLADRSDISEELVRLESHCEQVLSLLSENSAGRSLDFLAQELAREANTIGAKSADLEITRHAVELKAQIERLREIVQNIE